MKQNKVLWYFATGIVAWTLWAATFDLAGDFDPIFDPDVASYRIGARLGVVVHETNDAIRRQNAGMQRTVNHREERIEGRVGDDTK